MFYCREGGGGREGVRRGCSEDFWGIAWFSGEAEMILVFGNIIYKGSEILVEEFPSSEDFIDTKEKIEKI